MLSLIRSHPWRSGVVALAVLTGLAWLAVGYFGVHLLFVDDVVDEAVPVFDAPAAAAESVELASEQPDVGGSEIGTPATTIGPPPDDPRSAASPDTATEPTTTAPPTVTPPTTTPPTIATELVGTFTGDAHPTSGRAIVLGNGTGQRFLRFEQFETDNGPDLNVYLVNSATGDVADHVDLGDLSGNIGDQNYEIPADVDLSVHDRVVIWCVRFGVGFGHADLATP